MINGWCRCLELFQKATLEETSTKATREQTYGLSHAPRYRFDLSGTELRLQHFETKRAPQRSKTDLKVRNSVTGMHTAIFQHFETRSSLQRYKTDLKMWNSVAGMHTATFQHFETKTTPQRSQTDLKMQNRVICTHTATFQHFKTRIILQRSQTDLKVWNSVTGMHAATSEHFKMRSMVRDTFQAYRKQTVRQSDISYTHTYFCTLFNTQESLKQSHTHNVNSQLDQQFKRQGGGRVWK